MRRAFVPSHVSPAVAAAAALLVAACHDNPLRPQPRLRTTSYVASAVHCNATVAPASATCASIGSVRSRTRAGAVDAARKLVAAKVESRGRRTLNAARALRTGRRPLSATKRPAPSARRPGEIIIGGQDRFVRLNFYAPTFDAGTREYAVTGDVWNLLQQTIGVLDFEGEEVVDTAGVKVFLASGPSPSPAGPGTVTITNADGVATFIVSSAPYFKMSNDALAPNQYTGGRTWRMHVDPGVTAFEFTVFVAASVIDESEHGMIVGPAGFYDGGATGGGGACMVRPPAGVYCWGDASTGALGDAFDTRLLTPTASPISGTLAQVVMGAAHGCGIRTDGVAVCWGYGAFGQTGLGAFLNIVVPADVVTLLRFDRLAAGGQSTCGIVEAGVQVVCWGRNDAGQLGDGTTTTSNVPVPVSLPAGKVWNSITVGDHHACATSTDGDAFCWGGSESGQLGIGGAAVALLKFPAPQQLPGTGWTQVAAGLAHTCGLQSGSVLCWGRSMNGETGAGFIGAHLDDPSLALAGPMGFIAAGGHNTCALPVGGGQLRCWGANDRGQVGDATTTDRSSPSVGASENFYDDVTVGDAFSCARRGLVLDCWGSNENSELGVNLALPYISASIAVAGAEGAVSIAAGRGTACIANETPGVLVCWGSTAEGAAGSVRGSREMPLGIRGLGRLSHVSMGANHACGIDPDGRLFCWGSNRSGQLALGSFVQFVAIPAEVALPVGVDGWSSVAAGRAHTCAISTFGDLYCWGANEEGQVGTGALSSRVDTPTRTLEFYYALAVSAGGNHTCAVASSEGDEVLCWGSNRDGQVGTGATTPNYSMPQSIYVPATVVNSGVGTLSAGARHTCAIYSLYTYPSYENRLFCWGANEEGQVPGSTLERERTPQEFVLGSEPEQVVAGRTHSCVLIYGEVSCWGGNDFGQVAATVNRRSGVALLPFLPYAVSIFSGSSSDQTCILAEATRTPWCWGTLNSRHEYGTGSTWLPNAHVPAVP